MGKKAVKFSTIGTVEKLLKSWKLFQMLKCWKIVEKMLKIFLLKTVESLWKSWNVERLLKTCWKLFQLFNFLTLLLKTYLLKSWKVRWKSDSCRSCLNNFFNKFSTPVESLWKTFFSRCFQQLSTPLFNSFNRFSTEISGRTNFHSKSTFFSVTIFCWKLYAKIQKWLAINKNEFSTDEKWLQKKQFGNNLSTFFSTLRWKTPWKTKKNKSQIFDKNISFRSAEGFFHEYLWLNPLQDSVNFHLFGVRQWRYWWHIQWWNGHARRTPCR